MFLQALTLIFIVLKLTDVVDWSWWVVLSPAICAVVLAFIASFTMEIIGKRK